MANYSLYTRITHWLYHVESVRVGMHVHDGYFVCGKLVYVGKYYWTIGQGE